MRRAFSTLLCLVGPVAAVVVSLPIALLPLEGWRMGATGSSAFSLAVAAPAYLALGAAPGYVYYVMVPKAARDMLPGRRWWVRLSLAAAVACSLVGLWAATLMWLFGLPSLLSLICAAVLWRRFERAPTTPV